MEFTLSKKPLTIEQVTKLRRRYVVRVATSLAILTVAAPLCFLIHPGPYQQLAVAFALGAMSSLTFLSTSLVEGQYSGYWGLQPIDDADEHELISLLSDHDPACEYYRAVQLNQRPILRAELAMFRANHARSSQI